MERVTHPDKPPSNDPTTEEPTSTTKTSNSDKPNTQNSPGMSSSTNPNISLLHLNPFGIGISPPTGESPASNISPTRDANLALEEMEHELIRLRASHNELLEKLSRKEGSVSTPQALREEPTIPPDVTLLPQQTLNEVMGDKEELSDQLIESRRMQEELNNQVVELSKLLSQEKSERLKYDRLAFNTQAENVRLEGELNIANQRIENMLDSSKWAHTQMLSERDNLKSAYEEVSSLKIEKHKLEVDLGNLNKAKETTEKALSEQKQKYEDQLSTAREEQVKLKTSAEQSDIYYKKSLELKTEMIQVKDTIIKKHEDQLSKYSAHIKELSQKVDDDQQVILGLQENTQDLQSQINLIQEEKENMKSIYGNEKDRQLLNLSHQQVRDIMQRKFNDSPQFSADDKALQLVIELESKTAECLEHKGNYLNCKSDYDQLKTLYDDMITEKTKIEEKNNQLGREVSRLHIALQSAFKKHKEFDLQNSDLKQSMRNTEEKLTFLNHHCDQLVEKITILMYDKELESNEKKGTTTATPFESYSELVEQNNQLRINVQRLMKAKEGETNNKVTQLELDVKIYKGQLEKLSDEREKFANEALSIIEDLKSQREELLDKIKDLTQTQPHKQSQQQQKSSEETNENGNVTETLVQQLNIVMDTLKNVKKESQENQNESMNLSQKLAVTKASEEYYKNTTTELIARIEELQKSLLDNSLSLTRLEEQYQHLLKDKEALKNENKLMKLHEQELKSQIDHINSQLKLEKSTITQLNDKHENLIIEHNHRMSMMSDSLAQTKVNLMLMEKQYNQLLDKNETDLKLFHNQIKTVSETIKFESQKKRKLEEQIRDQTVEFDNIKKIQNDTAMQLSINKTKLDERTKQIEYLKSKRAAIDDQTNWVTRDSLMGATEGMTTALTASSPVHKDQNHEKLNEIEKLKSELESAQSMQKHWKDLASQNKEEIEHQKKLVEKHLKSIEENLKKITEYEHQVSAATDQLVNLETEKNELLKEIDNLNSKLHTQTHDEVQASLKLAHEKLKTLLEEKKLWRNDKEQLEQEIRNQIQSRGRDIEQFNKTKENLTILEKNLSAVTSEKDEYIQQLNTLKSEQVLEHQLLLKKVSTLQSQLSRTELENHKLENLLNERMKNVSDETLKLHLQDVIMRKSELESQLEEAHVKNAHQEAIQNRLENELREEREKLKNEQKKIMDMKMNLEEHQSLMQKMGENASLRSSLEHLRLEREATIKSMRDLQVRLDGERENIEPLKLKNAQLGAQISSYERQIKQLEEQVASWKKNYEKIATLYDGLDRDEFIEAKKKSVEYEAEVKTLNDEKKQLLDQNKELSTRLDHSNKQIISLSESLAKESQNQSRINSLLVERNFLISEKNTLTTEKNTLLSERDTLKNKITESNEQLLKLRNENQTLLNTESRTKLEYNQEQQKNKKLTEQLRIAKSTPHSTTQQPIYKVSNPPTRNISGNLSNSLARMGKLLSVTTHIAGSAVNNLGESTKEFQEKQRKQEATISELMKTNETQKEVLEELRENNTKLTEEKESLLQYVTNMGNQKTDCEESYGEIVDYEEGVTDEANEFDENTNIEDEDGEQPICEGDDQNDVGLMNDDDSRQGAAEGELDANRALNKDGRPDLQHTDSQTRKTYNEETDTHLTFTHGKSDITTNSNLSELNPDEEGSYSSSTEKKITIELSHNTQTANFEQIMESSEQPNDTQTKPDETPHENQTNQ